MASASSKGAICGRGNSIVTAQRGSENAGRHRIYRYQCSVCGRQFQIKDHMIGHMATHTGGKPYKCCCCGAEFKWRSTLNRHTKKLHEKH
ncbi:hypothetical protein LSH36_184g01005 [Paralvinella palmiformis]|uniref:C2H2-type domain-containing protein n=1 Tax=Paralvinella palmiformis TaxID=53620 RepID=A0AAD9JR08_9ANNE|nr:hypothetical protein LSH36_184g01005 [Paralvinella palmiformis]